MTLHLSPNQLAREVGMDRRDVIELCIGFGVPIFQGRIDKTLFRAQLAQSERDVATWVLLDSTGNLIDSFEELREALIAKRRIRDVHRENNEHVALIGYDGNGEPIAGGTRPQRPSSSRSEPIASEQRASRG
jgi:hypothetical protein